MVISGIRNEWDNLLSIESLYIKSLNEDGKINF